MRQPNPAGRRHPDCRLAVLGRLRVSLHLPFPGGESWGAVRLTCSPRAQCRTGMWYDRRTRFRQPAGGEMNTQETVSQDQPDVVHAVAEEAAAARMVDHFTVDERAARGKATRAEVPRSSPRRVGGAAEPRRPRRAARGAGPDARPGAGADPLRPDAGVAVHVLPRRRRADGRRSRGRPAHRADRPALRRRPSLQLRHLRDARPPAHVRGQRLRRDAGGAVRVGHQAAGRQLRGGRARPRFDARTRAGSTAPSRGRTASRCASSPR